MYYIIIIAYTILLLQFTKKEQLEKEKKHLRNICETKKPLVDIANKILIFRK